MKTKKILALAMSSLLALSLTVGCTNTSKEEPAA